MGAQALRFVASTDARSSEVRAATWDEFELGEVATLATSATLRAVWTIPAARMQKNDREHRVPLSPEALGLLHALPRMDGSPFVFFRPTGRDAVRYVHFYSYAEDAGK